jgi:tryptophanyl-tRNA synthetase
LVEEYGDGGYGRFKVAVAEAIADALAPIRSRYDSLEDAEVEKAMARGAASARDRAEASLRSVREKVGIA